LDIGKRRQRKIRMIKLQQKVFGCLRTLAGAQQFCAIHSYLATAAKHGIHFFAALTALAEGHPNGVNFSGCGV